MNHNQKLQYCIFYDVIKYDMSHFDFASSPTLKGIHFVSALFDQTIRVHEQIVTSSGLIMIMLIFDLYSKHMTIHVFAASSSKTKFHRLMYDFI